MKPDPDDDARILRLYASLSSESMAWRRRIDVTANWAIPLVIAVSTFALGEPRLPHFALLALGGGMIALAAVTDARRYREAHHAAWRARLVDFGYFAPHLDKTRERSDWRADLAGDLRRPRPLIGLWTATKARMRTTYLALVDVLVAAWVVKVLVHPNLAKAPDEVLDRMAIGGMPGAWVGVLVGLGVVAASVVALRSPSMAQLEDWGADPTGRPASEPDQSNRAGTVETSASCG